jgi:anti-anti-sigma factor
VIRAAPAERTDEIAVLRWGGDLDVSDARRFGDAIRGAEARRPAALVLDLRRVSFLDSWILREIVGAHVRARREGSRLAVALGSAAVRRVFRITLLVWRLEIVDDPDDVLGGIAEHGSPG